MRQLNGPSLNGGSPNFYSLDPQTLLVQGYPASDIARDQGAHLPVGEDAVTVSALLAIDAAAALDPRGMNNADRDRMLGVFGVSAFHLETQSYYAVDAETPAFRAWQTSGAVPDADDPVIVGWLQLVARHTNAGHEMRRVHVTEAPPTDYLRFELAVQQEHSVPAGEQVRTADAGDVPDFVADADDFWLFDDRVGVWMIHDHGGNLVRLARMTPDQINRAREIRDTVWAFASDLAPAGVR